MNKILVFGGSGLVGSRFIELNKTYFEIKAPDTNEVDILNKNQVNQVIKEFDPESIVNFAAYTNVQEAENEKDNKAGICYQINAMGAKNVAETCRNFEKHLVHISTEYVFDGTKEKSAYIEEDKPNPINWYGTTKLFGEEYVLETGCKACVVRISMPFSSHYELKKDVARFFYENLKNRQIVKAVDDQRITPTLVSDIANSLKVLIEKRSRGLYHVCSRDSVTPVEFVKTMARIFGFDYQLINSIKLEDYNRTKKAKLLKYSWLNPQKFDGEFGDQILHTIEEGLTIFKQEIDQTT